MTHPTYDKSDPKAGQPVLVGDTVYMESNIPGVPSTVRVVITAITLGADGVYAVHWADGYNLHADSCRWFSAPPAPAIEACVCGGTATVATSANGNRAMCSECGRTGPGNKPYHEAIASWNADMRALKHEPQADELKHVECKHVFELLAPWSFTFECVHCHKRITAVQAHLARNK